MTDFENSQWKLCTRKFEILKLTKNEFTETYVFAPGGFTVVVLASGNQANRQQPNSDWVFWGRFKSRRGNIFYFFGCAKNKGKRCRNLEFCPSGSQTRSVATVTLYFTLLGGLRFIFHFDSLELKLIIIWCQYPDFGPHQTYCKPAYGARGPSNRLPSSQPTPRPTKILIRSASPLTTQTFVLVNTALFECAIWKFCHWFLILKVPEIFDLLTGFWRVKVARPKK